MSAPTPPPPPAPNPRKRGHGLTVLLGATGVVLWLCVVAAVVGIGGFVALVFAYSMLHRPPHSGSGGYGPDGGPAGIVDGAGD